MIHALILAIKIVGIHVNTLSNVNMSCPVILICWMKNNLHDGSENPASERIIIEVTWVSDNFEVQLVYRY